MSNNILINVNAETQGLDEANAKLKKLSESEQLILQDMKDLNVERNKAKFYAKSVQEAEKASREYGKMIETNRERLINVRKEQDKVRKSIEQLSQAQKAMPGEAVVNATTKSFQAMHREIQNNIRSMKAAGASAQELQPFIDKAGELHKIQLDVNRELRNMASNTQGFDMVVDATQLAAGGFSALRGTMALFGTENENLQRTMMQLQAAMALVVGLQQVGNKLQTGSNIMRAVAYVQTKALAKAEAAKAVAINAGTIATIKATIAQKVYNKVAKMNPKLLLAMAIISVVGALGLFIASTRRASEAQRELNDETQRGNHIRQQLQRDMEFSVELARAEGRALQEILEIRRKTAQQQLEIAENSVERLTNAIHEIEDKGWMRRNVWSRRRLNRERKELREHLDEQTQAVETYWNRIVRTYEEATINTTRTLREAEEQRQREIQQALERRRNEILNAERALQDARIKAIQDTEEREIATLQLTLQRRLAEIKGNSQAEIDLRVQLEENAQRTIAEIREKHAKLREKEERDSLIKEREAIHNAEILELTKMLEKGVLTREQFNDRVNELELQTLEHRLQLRRAFGEDTVDLEIRMSEQRIRIAEKENERYERFMRERKQMLQDLYRASADLFMDYLDLINKRQINSLRQQLDNLNNFYTTDVELARKNANMKLITEEALAQKKLEINRKIAKAERNQALFQAKIDGFAGVVRALSAMPPPFNIALAAITAAAVAIQIANIKSQPLPGYWKGRKGGKRELARVGEHGTELMYDPNSGVMKLLKKGTHYLPKDSSIMPAHETARALRGDVNLFEKWNMPIPKTDRLIPQMPNVPIEVVNRNSYPKQERIDYDKFGKAVGKHMRFPNNSVNVVVKNRSVVETQRLPRQKT